MQSIMPVTDLICLTAGGWDNFPKESKPFVEDALKTADLREVYTSVKKAEIESRDILIGFEKMSKCRKGIKYRGNTESIKRKTDEQITAKQPQCRGCFALSYYKIYS